MFSQTSRRLLASTSAAFRRQTQGPHLTRSLSTVLLNPIPNSKHNNNTNTNTTNQQRYRMLAMGAAATCAGTCTMYYSTTTTAHAKAVSSNPDSDEIVLYQYEACPFCSKVRSYLDYSKTPYRTVEVNPMKKKELAEVSPDYKKVPVITVGDRVFVESKDIIDHISGLKGHQRTPDEEKWRQWIADNIMCLLSPNIYRTPTESLQAFDYITDISNFSAMEKFTCRYFGAAVMYLVAKKNKKKMELTDEREALYKRANEWMTDAVGNKKFAGGNEPNLADTDMFGVMRALRHMDLTWTDLNNNTKINEWYQRMEAKVGTSSRVNPTGFDDAHLIKGTASV